PNPFTRPRARGADVFSWILFSSAFSSNGSKNKRISKGKKGGKKKAQDPFAKKDWYSVKAPSMFATRNVGQTLVTRTQGTKIASDGLKGRVFEVSLADLQVDDEQSFRKMRLRAEDVQGRNVLTNFWVSALRAHGFLVACSLRGRDGLSLLLAVPGRT
ncbi:unnamed protein product, partial [Closterium sp. NIES-54]